MVCLVNQSRLKMVENQNGYCQRSHKDMTLAVVCDIMTPTIGTVFVCNLKKCCVKADENGLVVVFTSYSQISLSSTASSSCFQPS